MCRLQFYRNIQKKSTNPSIRTLVSTLQCRFLCVFRILPYAHSANGADAFFENYDDSWKKDFDKHISYLKHLRDCLATAKTAFHERYDSKM